jgi:hypothetical protein
MADNLQKALFTVNPMVSRGLVYFYHITDKHRVEHQKFVGWSNSLTKPHIQPQQHLDKAPDQLLQHLLMRQYMDRGRGSHGLFCDVATLGYIVIFLPIFIYS